MSMFCFQCEQTAKGQGCTKQGVCGKEETTSNLQDRLTAKLIALATAAQGKGTRTTDRLLIDGLFTTVTNVSFNDNTLETLCNQVDQSRRGYPLTTEMDMTALWTANEDIRSLKSLLLFCLRGMAAYAQHAYVLGRTNTEVNEFFYIGLSAIGKDLSAEALLALVLESGHINFKCMELLDQANTGTYGTPTPVSVSTNVEAGPFIVVTGHDLLDLKLLLEQSQGKGVNIYTHGEMLPAHGYPELKKYPHLKGNFGTAWQSQQTEFHEIPAPILFTTNCLMPVRPSYADRVYTTSVVSYPEMKHIDGKKDFSPLIAQALSLGGYDTLRPMTGINGGDTLTTGFGHGTILSVADKLLDGISAGAIKQFLLVGGCDGAKSGRNYYTELVKQTPEDTVILTLGCGKYRFNDMNIGEIQGLGDLHLPRILDMGQCNDAYGAIKVALALAEALDCPVNDLPLTLVLSWYEQKAVCVLLTLLALGVKNIHIGPSLPAFVSPNILKVLVENYNLTPISNPADDLKNILG